MAQTTKFKIRRRDSERVVSDNLIAKEELKIGSQPVDIDLILNHPAVSPVHAIIRDINGRPWIFDVLDANATLLNGNNISSAPLLDGSEIQIGPFLLRIHREADALLITVERGLKAAVRPTADARVTPAEPGQPSEIGEEEQKALDISWRDRGREESKIIISTPLFPVGIYGKGKARFNWTPTADLKPPLRRRAWLICVFTAVTLASIGALLYWSETYSPGPVASAHSPTATLSRGVALATVSSCSDCHHVFGSKERDCAGCHAVPQGSSSPKGFDPQISDAHREANIGCVGCHSEHNGSEFPIEDVDNRSCVRCHNEKYTFNGKVLGAPHKGSSLKSNPDSSAPGVGYIRDANGVLTWNKQTGKEAVNHFHAEHPYALEKCNYCHRPGPWETDEWEKSPRASCQACHAVSFDVAGIKAIGPNCATCHKQHGEHKGLKLAIKAISDEELRRSIARIRENGLYGQVDLSDSLKPPEIGGAGVLRQGGVEWNWGFTSRLGFAPWHIWTASIGIFALAGTGLVAFGNIRRTKLLRDKSDRRRNLSDGQAEQETTFGCPKRPPPAYTFPIIDPDRCIGCHACIEACPHDVLAMSNENIAVPVALVQCMDDTRCQTACPTQACIVASTEKKIPEWPKPDRDQKTYMAQPGLYVIGEVAKIPLIKSAIVEGAVVIDHVEKAIADEAENTPAQYDVAIIGAGPAGVSAALRAVEKEMRYVVVERDVALATLVGYPTGKSVNLKTDGSEPKGLLPLPPNRDRRRREEILSHWTDLIAKTKIEINEHEECVNIEQKDGCFIVSARKGDGLEMVTYTSRKVVLAIGSSGAPTLEAKGVESTITARRAATKCQNCDAPRQPLQRVCSSCNAKIDESSTEVYRDAKVKYKLSNPAIYDGKRCVVVGGGNSAIEAAVQLTGFTPGRPEATFTRNNHVTLLVRSHFTPDLKFVNKMNLFDCIDACRIDIRFRTEIKEIKEDEVILKNDKGEEIDRIPNDYVFCCIGAQWPESFLEKLNIKILNKKKRH